VIVPEGALFYGERERRLNVVFHSELREQLANRIKEMHEQFARGSIPRAVLEPKCKSCSLFDICMPDLKTLSTASYIQKYLLDENELG
jgi:CRISPR-associated exonuclease Cas4